jgi:hypothetical protein
MRKFTNPFDNSWYSLEYNQNLESLGMGDTPWETIWYPCSGDYSYPKDEQFSTEKQALEYIKSQGYEEEFPEGGESE